MSRIERFCIGAIVAFWIYMMLIISGMIVTTLTQKGTVEPSFLTEIPGKVLEASGTFVITLTMLSAY